ncbi:hypothetical protein D1007_01603 [Hordeum vulgare]|nr:hypothetical protein D1007_01603 [Hordeum vulgare]
MALFRHFSNIRSTSLGQRFTCVSFVNVGCVHTHLKAGKKVEGYQSRWVLMDARQQSSFLVIPLSPPEQTPRWSHKKITDPRKEPVLDRVPSLTEAHMIGEMIIKELLGHHITQLQVHSFPLWEFTAGSDPIFLHATLPLYAYEDMVERVMEFPIFDKWGLDGLVEGYPITVSSSSGGSNDQDSEATKEEEEGGGRNSASDLHPSLRDLGDDVVADEWHQTVPREPVTSGDTTGLPGGSEENKKNMTITKAKVVQVSRAPSPLG